MTALSIPLSADMTSLAGYSTVFSVLADAIETTWDDALADTDPERLHDLRVAIRRTRSVLTNAKGIVPPDERRRFRSEFKWLGDVTGPARDLDVYVLEWDDYVAPIGDRADALQPVLAAIEQRRGNAHRVLAEQLTSDRARRLLPAWRAWLAEPSSGGTPAKKAGLPLGPVVADRISTAQRRLLTRGRAIRPSSAATHLHELRKDAKQLRYLLECFGGILPAGPRKAFVKRLKALQNNLGEHQDAQVHIERLRAFEREIDGRPHTAETRKAMRQLQEHLERRRAAARDDFAQRFTAYDSKATRRGLRQLLGAG